MNNYNTKIRTLRVMLEVPPLLSDKQSTKTCRRNSPKLPRRNHDNRLGKTQEQPNKICMQKKQTTYTRQQNIPCKQHGGDIEKLPKNFRF